MFRIYQKKDIYQKPYKIFIQTEKRLSQTVMAWKTHVNLQSAV